MIARVLESPQRTTLGRQLADEGDQDQVGHHRRDPPGQRPRQVGHLAELELTGEHERHRRQEWPAPWPPAEQRIVMMQDSDGGGVEIGFEVIRLP